MAGQVATILRTARYQFGMYFLGNPALQQVAFHQLANDMFCIRGTAAVATGQHLVATAKTIAHGLECSLDIFCTHLQFRKCRDKLFDSCHDSFKCSSARSKKSGLLKLPDFRTSILAGSFRDTQDGSPGWISFQTRMPLIPNCAQTAAEVSPPATSASVSDTSREISR